MLFWFVVPFLPLPWFLDNKHFLMVACIIFKTKTKFNLDLIHIYVLFTTCLQGKTLEIHNEIKKSFIIKYCAMKILISIASWSALSWFFADTYYNTMQFFLWINFIIISLNNSWSHKMCDLCYASKRFTFITYRFISNSKIYHTLYKKHTFRRFV